ncbi:MAG: Ig-like domain-containing protein, partial [Vicinamibacterales bacterium]
AAVKDAAGNLLSGQSVAWSSSATSVASISASGLVTAVSVGTAIITAASGNKVGVATITVLPEPIASITVSPTVDTMLVGESVQLVPTMRVANGNIVTGRLITWVSSAPTIATVSNSGLVSGIADGTATVTASVDNRSATATIRVFSRCSTALALPITVGQTINGSLATTDCQLTDLTYADGYALQVNANTSVQIDLTASFDTWLVLLELTSAGTLELRQENDDVDPDDPDDPNDPVNTNSRITFTLLASRQYFVLANSFDPNVTGDYQLKVLAAAPVIAQQLGGSKPGKAPVSALVKSLRVPGRR